MSSFADRAADQGFRLAASDPKRNARVRRDVPALEPEERVRRYLLQGRLVVTRVDVRCIEAVCAGLKGTYELGYRPGTGWWCSCGADGCPHLEALRLVTQPLDV